MANIVIRLLAKTKPKPRKRKVTHQELKEILMANFQEVKDGLSALAAGVDSLEQKIKDLKAEVAAGHVISQAELDELGALVSAISADAADDSDQ